MRPLRALALLLALLASSGCLASLRCPGCGNVWSIGGQDAGAYDALGRLRQGEGVVARAYEPEGFHGFAHPRLDAAWGKYTLVAVAWHPGTPPGHPLHGYADLSIGAANLSVTASDKVPEDELRAGIDGFLAGTTVLDAPSRARWADAMLANRTVTGEGRTSHALPNGTLVTEVTRTYAHGAALPVGVLRAQALFEEAIAEAGWWAPEEDETAQGGHVPTRDWTFSFSFPHREARVERDGARLILQTNAHGGIFGVLHAPEPVREAEARDLARRLLEDAGATGFDAAAWTMRGTLATQGGAPPQANPTGTPPPTPTAS